MNIIGTYVPKIEGIQGTFLIFYKNIDTWYQFRVSTIK